MKLDLFRWPRQKSEVKPEQENKEERRSELRAPSASNRWAIFWFVSGLIVLKALFWGGFAAVVLLPLVMLAGWVEGASRLFGAGKIPEQLVKVLPFVLGPIGLGMFVGARRLVPWVIGCLMLLFLLLVSFHGCSKMP